MTRLERHGTLRTADMATPDLLEEYRFRREQHRHDSSAASFLEPYPDCNGTQLDDVRRELWAGVQEHTQGSLRRLMKTWHLEIEDVFYLFDDMYKSLRFLNLVRKVFTKLNSEKKGFEELLRAKQRSRDKRWRPKVARMALDSLETDAELNGNAIGRGSRDSEDSDGEEEAAADDDADGDWDDDGGDDDEGDDDEGDDDERLSNRRGIRSLPARRPSGNRSSAVYSSDDAFTPSARPKRQRSDIDNPSGHVAKKPRSGGSTSIRIAADGSTDTYKPGQSSGSARTQRVGPHYRRPCADPDARAHDTQSFSGTEVTTKEDKTYAPWDPLSDAGSDSGPINRTAGMADVRKRPENARRSAPNTDPPRTCRPGKAKNTRRRVSLPHEETPATSLDGGSLRHARKKTKGDTDARTEETETSKTFPAFDPSSVTAHPAAAALNTHDPDRGRKVQTAATSGGPGHSQDAASRKRLLSDLSLDDHCVHQAVFAFNPDARKWYVADPVVIEEGDEDAPANVLLGWSQQPKALVPMRSAGVWDLAYLERAEEQEEGERYQCRLYGSHEWGAQAGKRSGEVKTLLAKWGFVNMSLAPVTDPGGLLSNVTAHDSGLYAILHALHLMHELRLCDLTPHTWRRRLAPLFGAAPLQPTASVQDGDALAEVLEVVRDRSWEENAVLGSLARQQVECLQEARKLQADAQEWKNWLEAAPSPDLVMGEQFKQASDGQLMKLSSILEHVPQTKQAMIRIRRLLQHCNTVHAQEMSMHKRARAMIDDILTRMDTARFPADGTLEALATMSSEDVSTPPATLG